MRKGTLAVLAAVVATVAVAVQLDAAKAITPVEELAAFVGGTNSKVDDYPLVDGWTVYVSKPEACKALRDLRGALDEGRLKKTANGCSYTYRGRR